MAQLRQQRKRLNPAGCPFRVSGGDRLREGSGKFQLSPCRDFPDEYYLAQYKKSPPGKNEKNRGGKKKEMVAATYHTTRRLKTIKVV
jgi:hypothetical protein